VCVDAYHADNEFARLSDFEQGFQVLVRVIELVNAKE
jgi:acetylornithine deacetylase/succinyl-diaminopimelate desuccinylase-like protein